MDCLCSNYYWYINKYTEKKNFFFEKLLSFIIVALALPLILAPYTRQLLIKNKYIIYRDDLGMDIPNDDPDIKHIRRY
jgi:ACR3 family arsenite efflux pump ArsB